MLRSSRTKHDIAPQARIKFSISFDDLWGRWINLRTIRKFHLLLWSYLTSSPIRQSLRQQQRGTRRSKSINRKFISNQYPIDGHHNWQGRYLILIKFHTDSKWSVCEKISKGRHSNQSLPGRWKPFQGEENFHFTDKSPTEILWSRIKDIFRFVAFMFIHMLRSAYWHIEPPIEGNLSSPFCTKNMFECFHHGPKPEAPSKLTICVVNASGFNSTSFYWWHCRWHFSFNS